MSGIVVNGHIKVKSFYLSFNKVYPHLCAGLWEKSGMGGDPDRAIFRARELENHEATNVAAHAVPGKPKEGSFEKCFKENSGITCAIHYWQNGRWAKLNPADGKTILNKLNTTGKADRAEMSDSKLIDWMIRALTGTRTIKAKRRTDGRLDKRRRKGMELVERMAKARGARQATRSAAGKKRFFFW